MPPKRKRQTGSSDEAPPENDVIDDCNRRYQSKDSDFNLISSDRLRFRMKKIHLMAAR
jgi:hypothetical protein